MKKVQSPGSRFARIGICCGVLVAAAAGFGIASDAGSKDASGLAVLAPADVFAAQQAPDGRRIYGTVCAACHQADGTGVSGVFPPLAGSEWVADEGRLVRVILHGLTGPLEVKGVTYSGMMPPFGGALNNAEVAAVATYVRSSWGNDAPAVTAAAVARIRNATADRKTPWTVAELPSPASR